MLQTDTQEHTEQHGDVKSVHCVECSFP